MIKQTNVGISRLVECQRKLTNFLRESITGLQFDWIVTYQQKYFYVCSETFESQFQTSHNEGQLCCNAYAMTFI